MPLSGTPAAPNKRKKTIKFITDLTHVTQDEYESEPEASEFDLGTKIRVPKDIMLEELTLLNNKGSKMFKMRKLRVEKFIYENNPDIFNSDSMDNFQKFVPSIGGQMVNVGGRLVGGRLVNGQMVGGKAGRGGHAPVPPPKPGSLGTRAGSGVAAGETASGWVVGAGGSGGSSADASLSADSAKAAALAKEKKKMVYVKTYVSPWERAMKGNEELVSTMKPYMPGPCAYRDLPNYKSFNRIAMPFGGFGKAAQLMTFQLPNIEAAAEDLEPAVVYQHDINSRPSFNRTPIGWVGSGETGNIPLEMDTMPFDGETDDL